jgi:carbonic anhydrase
MRLLEAIIDANHRALAGDAKAGLHPDEFASQLPIIALTCIDPRLNALLPQVLGVPQEQFIWLRNAGNIITGPVSSTMRSLALACAIKGGKEITVIGHTDCQVGKTTMMELIDKLRALGIERHLLPDNVNEYFGTFASEQQNVIKAADIIRHSPLIGSKVPVHGLMVDLQTGKLDWLVNGYQTLDTLGARWNEVVRSAGQSVDALKPLADFKIGEMKFPDSKIGEAATNVENWLSEKFQQLEDKTFSTAQSVFQAKIVQPVKAKLAAELSHAPPSPPPRIPVPPPVKPTMRFRKGG